MELGLLEAYGMTPKKYRRSPHVKCYRAVYTSSHSDDPNPPAPSGFQLLSSGALGLTRNTYCQYDGGVNRHCGMKGT